MNYNVLNFSIRNTAPGVWYASAIINGCKCGQAFRCKPTQCEAMKSLFANFNK